MARAYYSAPVREFLSQDKDAVLGVIARQSEFDIARTQRGAWIEQIDILKRELRDMPDGWLAFEFSIPRMGKRVDNILIYKDCVFVIEFKVGQTGFDAADIEQVVDYALDLYNFHGGCHDCMLVPILVATEAPAEEIRIGFIKDAHIHDVVKCNSQNLGKTIQNLVPVLASGSIDISAWVNAQYSPTPTIIEAAQAMYQGHSVKEISRNDAGAVNLTKTSDAIKSIIAECSAKRQKAVCFVTGVPGAGKTLAGLNIVTQFNVAGGDDTAIFLSGNRPLMDVLREALAQDEVSRTAKRGEKLKISEARRRARAFIQSVLDYRAEYLAKSDAPADKVVVIDEGQRMWNAEQMGNFLSVKKISTHAGMSEPEILMSFMNRQQDWGVIICLVGGGQEIHRGENGIAEWFTAVNKSYPSWHVYSPDRMTDAGIASAQEITGMLPSVAANHLHFCTDLHLSVSMRSFRSENVSKFVSCLLDNDLAGAKALYQTFKDVYPIHVTRDLEEAKRWVREYAHGSERYGLVVSSGALRLKKYGIWPNQDLESSAWFLKGKDDIRSSFFLEEAATEFFVQGLELDWAIVAWDANLRRENRGWACYRFSGARWTHAKDAAHLKNAYRVLLTRARQGMVIFVPEGDASAPTRNPAWYDGIYECLSRVLNG